MITFDFSRKTVVVTGSSRGIGAAILEGFARAGADCVLHYWDDPDGVNRGEAQQLAEQFRLLPKSPAIELLSADVRNAAEVEQLMRKVEERFGGLDILVNNAGILRDRSIRKMTTDDWQDVIQTNLTGVFHGCKYGVEILRDHGRIVNIASVAGLVGIHGQANYAAAKAGVIGLSRSLAKELARRQITVNAVAPGVVNTTMVQAIKPELMAEYLRQIPLGRLAEPSEIANVVLFLSSPEAGYITGQVIPVTGGWLI
jgi:3-oxoacyl-[acyl-carrier protein] reductase